MNLIPRDKIAHFIAGALVALVFFVAGLMAHQVLFGLAVGAMMSFVAGCLKEDWDMQHGGTLDQFDMLTTFAGGVTASVLLSFVALFSGSLL